MSHMANLVPLASLAEIAADPNSSLEFPTPTWRPLPRQPLEHRTFQDTALLPPALISQMSWMGMTI